MTREAFHAAVAKMQQVAHAYGAGNGVDVTDFYTDRRRPYRYAKLRITRPKACTTDALLVAADLAVDVDGHMSMFLHGDVAWIDVSISRDLAEDELRRDVDLTASFPVEESSRG